MMPPPPSPARRPKSTTPRREFSQPRSPAVNSPYWGAGASPCLEGPGAVPEYLFSPARQERFGARTSPKYQDLGLDFHQPQSVGSVDLDVLCPTTATVGHPAPQQGPDYSAPPRVPDCRTAIGEIGDVSSDRVEDETSSRSVDSTRETSKREGDGLPDDQTRIGGGDGAKETAPSASTG